MLHIYFVRHGQTDWNFLKKFQGQQDVHLNELGKRQSQAVAKRLMNVPLETIYSSDLARARETAQIINRYHDLPLVKEPRLRERCFGIFEGFTIEESQERYPDVRASYEQDKLNSQIPGGESRMQFIRRVGDFFETLHQNHDGQTIAVIAHGGVLGATFSH